VAVQGGERQTPLAARLREPTEEERAEAAVRQQSDSQPDARAPPREGNDALPPLPAARGERDSNSTGSTGSTEKSIDHPQRLSSSEMKNANAALQAKLAMDALERRDYELLALITQSANGSDAAAVDQPGGPRAPGTPTRPHGSAAYVNGHSRPRTSGAPEFEQPRTRGAEGAWCAR